METTQSVTLNYLQEGEGPPLLLIHGFGISFDIWRELIPYLSPHFRLVMVELPGIGRSPFPQTMDYIDAAVAGMEALRSKLGIQRWHVVSYSTGARLGEHYACLVPQHIDRSVFLCPAYVDAVKAGSLRMAIWVDTRLPVFGNYVLSGRRLDFLIRWLGFSFEPSPHSANWTKTIGSQSIPALKATLRSLPGNGGSLRLLPPTPHLTIWGSRDSAVKIPRKPTGNDLLIPATHAAPMTNPRGVAEAILSFLSTN